MILFIVVLESELHVLNYLREDDDASMVALFASFVAGLVPFVEVVLVLLSLISC